MAEHHDTESSTRAHRHEFPLEALGQAMRREREALGISVRQMAARLGCSASHVSQVERGVTSPSIHTLYRMVQELGLSLDDLLAEVAQSTDAASSESAYLAGLPCRIVRAADRRSITLAGGVRWDLLIPTVENGFEFVEYVYEVGGHDGDDSFRRSGWEYGVVLEGRLGGTIGFAECELDAGDSIAFDSGVPHRFWNAGDVPAKAVWVWHDPAAAAESVDGLGEPRSRSLGGAVRRAPTAG